MKIKITRKNMNDIYPQSKGTAKLRALLYEAAGADTELLDNPIYVEGFEDGRRAGYEEAQDEYKKLIRQLIKLYDNEF
jgi:flagellar biosynthesis/type III secretory pathway protein FliH